MRLLLAVLLAWPVATLATGLPSLRISGSARATALAEVGVALPDAQALNPAALHAQSHSAAFSHAAWIQDVRQDYLHLTWARTQSIWSLSGQLWQSDDLERRTGPSAEPLGRFGVYEGVVGLAYASLRNRMRWGVRLNLIRQSISTRNASGGAADLGLVYDLNPQLYLGAALRNLGDMGTLDRESTALPREIRLGLSYTGRDDLIVAIAAQHTRGGDLTLHLGGEYRVGGWLSFRAGYQTTENRNLATGVGLAAGHWTIDYAYAPFGEGLGDAHRLTLRRESPAP